MKHYYSVIFPQGTIQKTYRNGVLNHTTYTKYIDYNSQDAAYKVMIEMNGGYFEKIQVGKRGGKFGRWSSTYWVNPKYEYCETQNDIWDAIEKENLPQIVLPDIHE